MDPALQELLEGDSDDSIEAMIRLRDPARVPAGFRIVSQFGAVASGRLARRDIRRIWSDPSVRSLKAARLLKVEERGTGFGADFDARYSHEERRPLGVKETGAGVVVGVIDWGMDFDARTFRTRDGGSRLLALWDQRGEEVSGAARRYGYGRAFTRADIDAALRERRPYEALGYHPGDSAPRGGAHGTHVADIAAGNGRHGGPKGMAPAADIIFVHLSAGGLRGLANLGDSVRILEAVDFIHREAGNRPCAINMSVGRHAGPHTGRTLLEQGIDALLASSPGRAIIMSAGNYYMARAHAAGRVAPGRIQKLLWRIEEGDPTSNEAEVWYSNKDTLSIALTAPDRAEPTIVRLGENKPIIFDGRTVGRLYHRANDPNTPDHHIDVFLYTSAPSGEWTIELRGEKVVDGRFHAWIERDSPGPGAQSRFTSENADPTHTIGSICNGYLSIACGAADIRGRFARIASFSSEGPTRDGRQKPDIVAPGVAILAAASPPLGRDRSDDRLTRKSGASQAAPYATGAAALLFQAAGRPLSIHETRRAIIGTARHDVFPQKEARRYGAGLLDVEAALYAVRLGVLDAARPFRRRAQMEVAMRSDETRIDQAIESLADGAEGGLPRLLGETVLRTPARALRPVAARLFDNVVYGQGAAEELGDLFNVIALPGETLDELITSGDIAVWRGLADGDAARFFQAQELETLTPGAPVPRNILLLRRTARADARNAGEYGFGETGYEALGLPDDDEEAWEGFEAESDEPDPAPRGAAAPFAPNFSTGAFWPIATSHTNGRLVSYRTASGRIIGRGGRIFGAARSNGARYHVGIDLFGRFGDPVFAIEDGEILRIYPFCCGANKTSAALFVQHTNVVVNYGEVNPNSLSALRLRPGARVSAGQQIGTVGRNPGGSSMIHFETYAPGTRVNKRWMRGAARPQALLNPTRALLDLKDNGLDARGAPPTHRPQPPTISEGHVCLPGEGPPAAIPDPEGRGLHPLIYRGTSSRRSRNPTVGDAQRLLNNFLQTIDASMGGCTFSSPAQVGRARSYYNTLAAAGQNPLVVDCRFGPNTDRAARLFQLCKGLVEDGKIGPQTWPPLEAYRTPVTPPITPPIPPVTPPAISTLNPARWRRILARAYRTSPELQTGNAVQCLIDGRETFREMVAAIRSAQTEEDYIYLLGWVLDDNFELIPGDPKSTARRLFSDASARGVQIRAMLWDQVGRKNTAEVGRINALPNGAAILDDETLLTTAGVKNGSHHQKVLVVQGRRGLVAFCGGIDLNDDRIRAGGGGSSSSSGSGAPLHDVHCRIEGPSAFDLLHTFIKRWDHHPGHFAIDRTRGDLRGRTTPRPAPFVASTPANASVGRTSGVAIARTILPVHRRPNIRRECDIRALLLASIAAAKRFIYMEEQYLISQEAARALNAAARRLKHITILISASQLVGELRCPWEWRLKFFNTLMRGLSARDRAKVRIFHLASPRSSRPPRFGRHTYVHAKAWIFDDELAVIGSANCNQRGWETDSEVNAFIFDDAAGLSGFPITSAAPSFAQKMRMRLWAEHLAMPESSLIDGVASARHWLSPPAGARIEAHNPREDTDPVLRPCLRGTVDPSAPCP